MKRTIIVAAASFTAAASLLGSAIAANFTAVTFEFDPTNTNRVAAEWVRHLGERDETGTQNYGLLLSKNTASTTNASAGAVINGVKGITLTELNFDIRDGSHCGAGAPRFNVVTSDGVTHFLGCAAGTKTPAVEPGWTHVQFSPTNPAQAFPIIQPTQTVESIAIIFDEGTENVQPPPFDGRGFAILDNISINNQLITRGGN